jgi:hypothetical protein
MGKKSLGGNARSRIGTTPVKKSDWYSQTFSKKSESKNSKR